MSEWLGLRGLSSSSPPGHNFKNILNNSCSLFYYLNSTLVFKPLLPGSSVVCGVLHSTLGRKSSPYEG